MEARKEEEEEDKEEKSISCSGVWRCMHKMIITSCNTKNHQQQRQFQFQRPASFLTPEFNLNFRPNQKDVIQLTDDVVMLLLLDVCGERKSECRLLTFTHVYMLLKLGYVIQQLVTVCPGCVIIQ